MWKTKIKRFCEVSLCLVLLAFQVFLETQRHALILAFKSTKLFEFPLLQVSVGGQPILVLVLYSIVYVTIFTSIVYLYSKDKLFTRLLVGIDVSLLIISFLILILKRNFSEGLFFFPSELSLILYRLTNSPLLYIIIVPTYFLYKPTSKKGIQS